ncbi:MAG: hypothetical protein AABN33_20335 [Acidobacteriota bacterium]
MVNENPTSRTALLFDIDNTLTPPRQVLRESMANVLKRLCLPFHVVAGSHLDILQEQFFDPLYAFGFRKQFEAFLSLGGVHYRCDYSKGMSIEVVSAFDMREYLGDIDYCFLMDVLTKTLGFATFRLPPTLEVIGETITYRGSMINFCPIGRAEQESTEYRRNRDNFVEFDRASNYRQIMMEHLKGELSSLVKDRKLTIVLGGQTSFDISVATRDKTYAVRTLLDRGFERLVFMGDALFDGGNDAAIREFAENWRSETRCPLETIQVSGWEETIRRLYELQFVAEHGD